MTPESVPASRNTPYPLELENITCVFGSGARQVTALDSVNLQLSPGELVAVMGPSGSGSPRCSMSLACFSRRHRAACFSTAPLSLIHI